MPELFKLVSPFKPTGDQPQAIEKLVGEIKKGRKRQVLLGVTGSGKTFTMANVISEIQKPTLILAHNKTLASQLYLEFKELFPENAVEYFVSYYDYYQPEAYLPATDTFIEKDSSINEEIDKMRHSATHSLLTRKDVIIVASVSCIYGLGSNEDYQKLYLFLKEGIDISRDDIVRILTDIRYQRNDYDFSRGNFRVKGNTIDIFPAYENKKAIRVQMSGDHVDSILELDPLLGKAISKLTSVLIYPASHYVTTEGKIEKAITSIKQELELRLKEFDLNGKILERERLKQRTHYDIEMLAETGFCTGIENYSRHIAGRAGGERPDVLLDYFPNDFLMFIDESHVMLPQVRGMYNGDRARKMTLVEHGFRLPSALDNRPLQFDEFDSMVNQVVYVSATPNEYEIERSERMVVEQIIRPTGLIDPEIFVRPAKYQVDNLMDEIKKRVAVGERVLVTTLTKRMSEELADYMKENGVKVRYLHSDIETIERSEIIRDLRKGEFDVLIGINLLREGLDIPEVSLVAILDADKEGFLRSEKSLIQTCGRAARHINGNVIMYADTITESMKKAISETNRRRKIQQDYNETNHITPTSIIKTISSLEKSVSDMDYVDTGVFDADPSLKVLSEREYDKKLNELTKLMKSYAKKMEFEKAAKVRDDIIKLKENNLLMF